jgi:hypothetical protein
MARNVDDLKKIIANLLETSGRTEEEILVMQAKAAKMMHQLGLTREDIFAKKPDMWSANIQITRFDWIVAQFLMSAVEHLTGTECWYEIMPTPTGKRSDRKLVYFAGYRSDVDQALWVFTHVLEQATAGARGISVTSERNSYLVGFASMVARRIRSLGDALRNIQEHDPAAAPSQDTSWELVLARKEEVVKGFVNQMAPGLVPDQTKGTAVRNGNAFRSGREDGARATLGRSVAQGALAIGHSSTGHAL